MAFALPIAGYNQSPIGGNQNAILALIMQALGQSQSGQAEAKQANESRYNDILQQLSDAKGRSLGALDSLSGQEVTDANTSYDNKRNELLTDLADRGLGGSTKRIAVEAMTKRERDAAVNRIKDAMALNKNATDERFTDKTAGVMERRSDPYPNNSNLAGIFSQLAPLLSGMGGGGGGNPGYYGNQNAMMAAQYAAPQMPNSLPGSPSPPSGYQQAPASIQELVAKLNASQAPERARQDEANRQPAMIALRNASHVGGLEGEAQVQNALTWLQQNNWAKQNPNTVSVAPFQTVPYQTGYGSGGGYAPSYAAPRPGLGTNSAYQYRQAANAAASRPPGSYGDMMQGAWNQMQQPAQAPDTNVLGNIVGTLRNFFGV